MSKPLVNEPNSPENAMTASTPPLGVLGSINHLRLTVTDIPKAKAFYMSFMGYLGYDLEKDEHDRLAWMAQDGHGGLRKFILTEAKPELKARHHDRYAPGLHHFGFNVPSREDVDNFYRLLTRQGIAVLDAPAEYTYQPGYYAVYFADPDGIKLEVVHIPPRYPREAA
jgi:glyoxylase I family protein